MYTCKLFAQRILPVFVVVIMVLSITFLTPVEEASAQEYIPTPVIYTIINTHTVLGLDFQPLEMITLKIDDPDTEENPDFQTVAQNPDDDLYDHTSDPVTFSLANIFPLKPGYVIEMSDSVSVQTLTLWNLSITNVDFTNDVVSGFTSRHGIYQSVNVQAYTPWLVDRYSYPDDDGYWTADFGDPDADPYGDGAIADLEPETYFFALQMDEYQNAVIFEWVAPEHTIPILDDFDRVDGPLGSNWTGYKSAYRILGNQVDVRRDGPIYWKDAFGVDQQVAITLSTIDPDGMEQNLLLKVQGDYGPNWGEGAIEVLYSASENTVTVWTFRPETLDWFSYPSIPVAFAEGDQFGAQALTTGDVVILKNGEEVGRVTLNPTDQAFFNSRGGHIGLWFINARNAYLDDFAGGDVILE